MPVNNGDRRARVDDKRTLWARVSFLIFIIGIRTSTLARGWEFVSYLASLLMGSLVEGSLGLEIGIRPNVSTKRVLD